MSETVSKAGRVAFVYEVVMSNDYKAQVTIYSGNPTEKSAYLKAFLEIDRNQDVFFVDDLTGTLYNKNHIVSCKEKEVVNG